MDNSRFIVKMNVNHRVCDLFFVSSLSLSFSLTFTLAHTHTHSLIHAEKRHGNLSLIRFVTVVIVDIKIDDISLLPVILPVVTSGNTMLITSHYLFYMLFFPCVMAMIQTNRSGLPYPLSTFITIKQVLADSYFRLTFLFSSLSL